MKKPPIKFLLISCLTVHGCVIKPPNASAGEVLKMKIIFKDRRFLIDDHRPPSITSKIISARQKPCQKFRKLQVFNILFIKKDIYN